MNCDQYLRRLYVSGCENDAAVSDRSAMMLNITPSTGVFLDLLISELKPKRILELGTSNGYSTIWLARAAKRCGSCVDSVELFASKIELAKSNLANCGLLGSVTLRHENGSDFLHGTSSGVYDFVFLDSDRSCYTSWSNDLVRVTRFGIIVVDNAISHASQMCDFKRELVDRFGLSVSVLPIGNGQLIIQKAD